MTDLEIALAGFCIVLIVDRILMGRTNAAERGKLLDRIQANNLLEYKALSERPRAQGKRGKPVDVAIQRANPALEDDDGEPIAFPDMTPGHYPEAVEAARSLME